MDEKNICELYLDSDDSYETNPANLRFSLDHVFGKRKFSRMKLKSCIIPNLEYGVRPDNNTLIIRENGDDLTDITITIEPSNYDSTSLVDFLNAEINLLASNSYQVLYEELNKKLTIALLSGTSFKIVDSPALNILGWTQTNFVPSYIGVNPVRLDLPDQFLIQFQGLNSLNHHSSGAHDIIASVPVTVSYGNILFYQDHSDEYIPFKKTQLQNISLRILDQNSRQVILPSNCSTYFQFNFY